MTQPLRRRSRRADDTDEVPPTTFTDVTVDVTDVLTEIDDLLEEVEEDEAQRRREYREKLLSLNFIKGGRKRDFDPCRDAIRIPAALVPFAEAAGFEVVDCGDCEGC